MFNRDQEQNLAVALAYLAGEVAPKVIAKGRGKLAKAIIEQGRQSGVYVHQSSELVSLLMQVDLDKHIPGELYRVVAELLAFIYSLEHQQERAGLPTLPHKKDKKPQLEEEEMADPFANWDDFNAGLLDMQDTPPEWNSKK